MKQPHKSRYKAWIWVHIHKVFTCVFLSQLLVSDAALESCYRGTYLTRHGSGMEICAVCPDGTFMPDLEHTNKQCYTCSQMTNPSVEVVVQPCNITHDAIIMCRDGYYRRRAPNRDAKDECVACTSCDHPTKICFNYTDTVCCLTKNYEAVPSSGDVYHCEERPCGRGQRFDEKADKCLPCPEGTYMPQDIHKHMSCLKCALLEHKATYHSRIVRECTDRSPTIFGCAPGFYRSFTSEPPTIETECTQCRQCPCSTLRSCSDFEDSICGPCDVTSTQSTSSTESGPWTRADNPGNCSPSTHPGPGETPSEDQSLHPVTFVAVSVLLVIVIVIFVIVVGCLCKRLNKTKQKYKTILSYQNLTPVTPREQTED
ncbi:hypothetical protein BsWGS_26440 [Bradybaena similaris]